MTTRESTESNEDAAVGTESADAGKDTGGGLRKQLESALSENKDLKSKERVRAFEDAGIDTSSGLGKAISQVYEGDASKEAIQSFASEEYGWQPPADDAHPQAQQISTEQARIDQVGATAGSVAPLSQKDEIAKAEAEGDYQRSLALKAQQVAQSL